LGNAQVGGSLRVTVMEAMPVLPPCVAVVPPQLTNNAPTTTKQAKPVSQERKMREFI
jgi:hypothetical protein